MFNIGGGELLVILLVALIVLGPTKLPAAARQVAGIVGELRRVSTSFQDEIRSAMDEPTEHAARERGRAVTSSEEAAAPKPGPNPRSKRPRPIDDGAGENPTSNDIDPSPSDGAEAEPPRSTAEAAGMYDIGEQTSDPDELS